MLELASAGRFRGLGAAPGDVELLAELDRELAPSLVGSDPTLIEAQLSGLASASAEARSAVELALWDLLGQLAGVPVHQIWGAHSQRIASMATISAGPAATDLISRAEDLLAQGFTALDLEVAGSDGVELLAPVQELRRELDSSVGLAVGWRPTGSIGSEDLERLVDQFEELDVLWLECSEQAGQESVLEAIRGRTRTLQIAAGAPDLPGLWKLVRSECCDLLRPGPQMASMLDLWKAAALAESASLGFLPPCPSTALAQQAQLHLCLAAPACNWLVLGMPQLPPGRLDADGCIAASPDPGFGFHVEPTQFSDSGVPAARC